MKSFGETMRKLRVGKQITLRKMSEAVGKTISYLSDIEQNRRRPPDPETVKKIEKTLEIDDYALSKIAAEVRNKIPDLQQKLRAKPNLANVLLRAENFSDEHIEKLLNYCNEIDQENKDG